MQIAFTDNAWNDYLYWQANDVDTLRRINALLKEIARDPFKGVGKPEPLKGNFAGCWSRRIDTEHRLVYMVSGTRPKQIFTVIQMRFHY
jgi:toxin YoeB